MSPQCPMARHSPQPGSGWLSDKCAGVILAGGRNSRMGGADKAFLMVRGRTVFERTLATLERCFPKVIVVSNDPEKYRRFDVDVVEDEFRRQGPLAGIHAALGHLSLPYAFVVACDMPFLRPEPIAYLVGRLRRQDAIIPEWEGDIEPLHALYARRLRDLFDDALRNGACSVRDVLRHIDVEVVPEIDLRSVQGAEESFRNVNTPEDAARFDVRA